MLVVTFLGVDLSNVTTGFNLEGAAAILFVLIPISYPLGVATDNLADFLLKPYSEMIRAGFPSIKTAFVAQIAEEVGSPYFLELIGYMRSRIRLSRSSALNLFASTISGIVWAYATKQDWKVTVLICFGGFFLSVFCLWSWQVTTKSYYGQLSKMFEWKSKK